MNLRGIRVKSKSFKHYLGEVSLREPLLPDIKSQLILELKAGSKEAAKIIIEAHMRLILQIAGRYYAHLWNETHLEDLVSEALTKVTESIFAIANGTKILSHDNISGYIVSTSHGAIANYLIDKVPIVPIPHSTANDSKIKAKSSTHKFGTLIIKEFKQLEFNDLLEASIKSPLEKIVIELRMSRRTDKDIGEICKISATEVRNIRLRVEERFKLL